MSEVPDSRITGDPRYKAAMNEFTTSVRMYWKRNVHKHFNLREAYWQADPARQMDHRISISTGENKILANVLEIHWSPDQGHVTVAPGKLMVRGGRGGNKAYNLIDILTTAHGAHRTQGAYRVEIDKRVPWGKRKAQTSAQWTRWMEVFIPFVDKKLNELADVVANITGDSVENIIIEEI